MGDLSEDTAIQGGDGRYGGRLSRDWEIWGPNGGYLAAFALRAAGAHCGRARPASLVGHFVGVGSFDAPIEIACTTVRQARVAHSVRTTITQAGRPLFEALVWGVDAELTGIHHHAEPMPEVAPWQSLPTLEERLASRGESTASWFPFWKNFDQRPPDFRDDWMARKEGEHPPCWQQWLRFRPTASFADPWIDACRLLILVDVGSWPAAQAAHNQSAHIAPSIDLACALHTLRPDARWLFVEGRSPVAAEGLVASHQRVWDERGVLLASGTSQLLCRPARKQP